MQVNVHSYSKSQGLVENMGLLFSKLSFKSGEKRSYVHSYSAIWRTVGGTKRQSVGL